MRRFSNQYEASMAEASIGSPVSVEYTGTVPGPGAMPASPSASGSRRTSMASVCEA
ncbi:hypothetical protein JHN56_03135 [Streptomyces sp. MBT60]|nr:hypothetical protein [Streptomyces sp. MBT60]MBK3542072.1 hypothetical protein [Streptomyces sp. MBT60]